MRRVAVLATLLALAVVLPFVQQGSGAAVDDWRTEIVRQVAESRIIQTILDLQAFDTRDFHTAAAAGSAVLIQQRMEEIGLDTQLQEFVVDGITVGNVIGTLNPSTTDSGVYLFGAHYDSRNSDVASTTEAENISAPGADDNASGVAAMLEVAGILADCERFEATTRFVAFGAEERSFVDAQGLAGSSAFVQAEADAGIVYHAAFIMDMIGFQVEEDVSRITIICDDYSAHIAESMGAAVDRYGIDLRVDSVHNDMLRYSDHASFWEHDYPSLLVIEQLDPFTEGPVNPYYHTESDTVDMLSAKQMGNVASVLIGTVLDLTYQGEDSYTFPYSIMLAAAGMGVLALAVVAVVRMKRRVGSS
jgi:Zn-dependent M28 family amino/carboxypeptidase